MATLTIERKQDMVVEEASLATVPATELMEVSYAEFATPAEADIELTAAGTFSAPKDGLLIRIGRGMLACYDWLSGPPMSAQERNRHKLVEAERVRWSFYP